MYQSPDWNGERGCARIGKGCGFQIARRQSAVIDYSVSESEYWSKPTIEPCFCEASIVCMTLDVFGEIFEAMAGGGGGLIVEEFHVGAD